MIPVSPRHQSSLDDEGAGHASEMLVDEMVHGLPLAFPGSGQDN